MINYRIKQLALLVSIFFFSISCQESPVNEPIDIEDEDLIAATQLAEEYLKSTTGRSDSESTITILKYYKESLRYATTTDDYGGYKEIDEETITAIVEPGEFVFWYSGGGVSDLDGIDFDDDSKSLLDGDPDEINSDLMWVIQIPEDAEDGSILKYDIVYLYQGYTGVPIVLDPKLKVQH